MLRFVFLFSSVTQIHKLCDFEDHEFIAREMRRIVRTGCGGMEDNENGYECYSMPFLGLLDNFSASNLVILSTVHRTSNMDVNVDDAVFLLRSTVTETVAAGTHGRAGSELVNQPENFVQNILQGGVSPDMLKQFSNIRTASMVQLSEENYLE